MTLKQTKKLARQREMFDRAREAAAERGADANVERSAVLSPCRRYRYELTRTWNAWNPDKAVFIGLNPSTADEMTDDPTIRKCIGFAKRWGCGGIVMLNLFAWRSTDPDALRDVADPIGPDTDAIIEQHVRNPRVRIIAAWGAHKMAQATPLGVPRAEALLRRITDRRDVLALRVTKKSGAPEHPLYVPYDVVPTVFRSGPNANPATILACDCSDEAIAKALGGHSS